MRDNNYFWARWRETVPARAQIAFFLYLEHLRLKTGRLPMSLRAREVNWQVDPRWRI